MSRHVTHIATSDTKTITVRGMDLVHDLAWFKAGLQLEPS